MSEPLTSHAAAAAEIARLRAEVAALREALGHLVSTLWIDGPYSADIINMDALDAARAALAAQEQAP